MIWLRCRVKEASTTPQKFVWITPLTLHCMTFSFYLQTVRSIYAMLCWITLSFGSHSTSTSTMLSSTWGLVNACHSLVEISAKYTVVEIFLVWQALCAAFFSLSFKQVCLAAGKSGTCSTLSCHAQLWTKHHRAQKRTQRTERTDWKLREAPDVCVIVQECDDLVLERRIE